MKQKIERLAKGIFEYEQPTLLLSDEKLFINAEAGKTYNGSFTISNTDEKQMRGIVYSSSRLIRLETSRFDDTEKKIEFQFDATKADAGETVTGEINIISECGEATLPFEAVIKVPAYVTSLGEVRDLFQFANLARGNRTEALQFFESEDFEAMLSHVDFRLINLYKGLLKSSSGEQALEEFLISIHKKQPVVLQVDKTSLEYNAGRYSFIDKLVLKKNTWGFADCKIYVTRDFISPEKTHITDKDFLDDEYELSFVINPDRMVKGTNEADIIIETSYKKIIIPVVCRCSRNYTSPYFEEKALPIAKRKRLCDIEQGRAYLQYCSGVFSVSSYVAEAERILQKYDLPESSGQELFRIYLRQLSGKGGNSQEALASLKLSNKFDRDSNPIEYATFLYLEAQAEKQGRLSQEACDEIRDVLRHRDDFRLLWILIKADKRYEYSRQQVFDDIKELAESGCSSPYLYYEAFKVVASNPVFLKEYGRFEQRLVSFAVKYDFVTKGISAQYSYLVGKEKIYDRKVIRTLVELYDRFKQDETVAAICTCLVEGFKAGTITLREMRRHSSEYHKWFELAIIQGLKVNEIFEYYLMTMEHNHDKVIAAPAVAYFSYESSISETDKAFLYACITKHPEYYHGAKEEYYDKIKDFVLQELKKGNINKNLAVLYNTFIPKLRLDYELAECVAEVAFKHELACEDEHITAACIRHKELAYEEVVPLKDGKAYVDIFTENAEVVLIGKDERRYAATIDFSLKKLLHVDRVLEECFECGATDKRLLLNLAERYQYYESNTARAVDFKKRAVGLPGLNPLYVRDNLQSLIYYYYDNYEGEILESYLMKIDLRMLEHKDRSRIIEFMIIRDLHNVALQAFKEFGFEGIDVKRIMKLCMRLLGNTRDMEKVDVLVEACHIAFKAGKYDETIIKYLADYYNGTTLELYDLWRIAKNEGVDTMDLEERLLCQQLFTETHISNSKAIFCSYYGKGMTGSVVEAYLCYYAYKYLMFDSPAEDEVFEIIKREEENLSSDVCMLSLLKWYSEKETLTDSEIGFIDYRLHMFEKRGIVLPFFRDFSSSMRISEQIYDKNYIQYVTDPKCKVTIHYSCDGIEGGKYISEEMRNVCYGIFVKDFVLFCNESLQYYITEEKDGQISITESSEVKLMPEQAANGDSKYYQLNLIITAREMQDEKTVMKLLESYVKTDYAISELFKPL